MDGVPATYLGKIVSKQHFRVFIYGPQGVKKLVESWDEYERHMASGLWFATRDEANTPPLVIEEPVVQEIVQEQEIKEEKPKRVKKDDDFLPKARK